MDDYTPVVKPLPDRVTPNWQAIVDPAWVAPMTQLGHDLQARHVMAVGARKIVAAVYGTEPTRVLDAFDAALARGWSIGYCVRRLEHGILNPAVKWPAEELR